MTAPPATPFTAGVSAPAPAGPAARIVGTYGYRVEGDTACLNAEIAWRPEAAEHARWRLQLWACPLDAPPVATLVAELPVTVPLHTQGEPSYVEGHVMALPPAGDGPQAMSLRLVAVDPGGNLCLHDEAPFTQPERFVQPRLHGVRCLPGMADGLALVVDRVLNPRPLDNLSGSLQLELWALEQPYRGGPFAGRCIGSLQLEALPGQGEAGPLALAVNAQAADGSRHWSLMLREWTAVGYVTRDHVPVTPPPSRALPSARAELDALVLAAGAMPASLPPAPPRATEASPRPRGAGGLSAGLGSRLMAHLRQFLQR